MAYNIYILILFFIQILIAASQSEVAKVPAIIVFGDSSVDTGNNNFIPTIARCNFQPYGRDFPGGVPTGRFCNGRLPTDFLSESFGLKPIVPAYLDPMYNISDFSIGVCFASAGTGYDYATADILKVIPLWKELEFYKDYQTKLRAYLGVEKANKVLSEALYTQSLGTNDFIENYYTIPGGRKSQFTIKQYQDFLLGLAEDFLRQLYDLGARKISLTGIAPMGCLPSQRTASFVDHHDYGCNEEYNNVALEFNGMLANLAAKLNKELAGFRVVLADGYHILLQLIKKPSRFGFEEAEVGCCGSGTFETGFLCNRHNPFTCPDANKYVFWDSVHPSEKANKIIADYLLTTFRSKPPRFLELKAHQEANNRNNLKTLSNCKLNPKTEHKYEEEEEEIKRNEDQQDEKDSLLISRIMAKKQNESRLLEAMPFKGIQADKRHPFHFKVLTDFRSSYWEVTESLGSVFTYLEEAQFFRPKLEPKL